MADYSPDAPLELRFSHNIIEHLGLKLYQNKPTNVLAELVSNSWDASGLIKTSYPRAFIA